MTIFGRLDHRAEQDFEIGGDEIRGAKISSAVLIGDRSPRSMTCSIKLVPLVPNPMMAPDILLEPFPDI
jgi:hypothetical protein